MFNVRSSPPPQNSGRIMRSLFEITLHQGHPAVSARLLTLCKALDHQQWAFEHPLKQFGRLSPDVVSKLEARKTTLDRLRDMGAEEIGMMNESHNVLYSQRVWWRSKFSNWQCGIGSPKLIIFCVCMAMSSQVLRNRACSLNKNYH